jgi:hypothetical protein
VGARSGVIRAGAVVAIAAGVVLGSALPGAAVPVGTVATFPSWNVTGSSTAYGGTAAFASPTLPNPTLTSTSASITTASGASAFLGPTTAFGTEFTSTRAQPYLTVRPGSASPVSTIGSVPNSVTTIDFGSTAPAAGWGFALGDVDADWVFVQAFHADGSAASVPELGERGTGNYCDTSPKPSTCAGVVAPFDVPNWTDQTASTPKTYSTGTITYSAATVYGNFADTVGAYIWFVPDPSVRRITLTYGALTGSPVFQLWLTQPAPTTTISGTVTLDQPGAAIPSGTAVQLNAADGTPVTDRSGDPVTVPVAANGDYTIDTEQRSAYQLQVLPPTGYAQPSAITVAALSAAVTAPAITLDPAAATAAPAAAPTLAESGVDAAPLAALALLLLLAGVAAMVATARR